MKKTVRKFFRLLDKDINRITAKFTQLIDSYLASKAKEFSSLKEFALNIEIITDSSFNQLTDEERQEFITMEQAKEIKEITSKGGPITDFELIQKFMNRYSLTELEQADILAYFLHLNLKGVLSLKAWCMEVAKETGLNYVDVCKNMVMQSIAEEQSSTPGIKGVLKSFLAHFDFAKQKEIREKVINMFETAERLKYVISVDGELLGCHSPHDYIKLTGASNFEITSSQWRLLLKASLAKHEQARKQSLETEKLKTKRAVNVQTVSQDTVKATDKERREALQTLKKSLENGMPIRFIEDEELTEITRMLIIGGYEESQIAIIQKNILANNQSIVEAKKQEAINTARVCYLSEEESLVVDKIIAIVNDETALKNAVYNKIIEDYNLLLEQLLKIGSKNPWEDFEDGDLELLHMCVEALNDSLIEYANCDYRRMLVSKN